MSPDHSGDKFLPREDSSSTVPRMSQLTGPPSPLPCLSWRVDGMNFQGHSLTMIPYKEGQEKGEGDKNYN